MATQHHPELRIGGNPSAGTAGIIIDVVDGYDLILDCFEIGSAFTFALWYSEDRNSTWDVIMEEAKVGAAVVFAIDGKLQLSGWIETREEKCDKEGAYILLTGRDIVSKAKDWDANPAIGFTGVTLDVALGQLYGDLQVPVILGVHADLARQVQAGTLREARTTTLTRRRRRPTTRVDRSHPRAGEKVEQVAEAMVRRAGLWMWSVPCEDEGTMALCVGSYDYQNDSGFNFTRRRGPTGTQVSGNMLAGNHTTQMKTIPTFIRVFGHCARGDKWSFRYQPGIQNDFIVSDDITAGRVVVPHPYQPRYVKSQRARTYEEGNQEAERILARAMKSFRTYVVKVQGHTQEIAGVDVMYHFNTTAMVVDDIFNLRERMFIHRVHFQGRRATGTTTTLTMVPLNSVQLTVGVEPES